MTNELTVREQGAMGVRDAMMPRSFDQVLRFAEMVAQTSFVPQAFKNKPGEIVAAVTYGAEVGLTPMQSLRSIGVINGSPALYGDGLLAVCQNHPQWAGKEERFQGDGEGLTAICTVKRKGEPDVTASFSIEDAKKASLFGKQGPWQQYPRRMLMMRARGFALRDQFADALRGMISEAEARDYPVGPDRARDVTPRSGHRRQAMADLDEVLYPIDADGTECRVLPAELGVWISQNVSQATAEQLDAMAEIEQQEPKVLAAITAEQSRRTSRKERGPQPPPADWPDEHKQAYEAQQPHDPDTGEVEDNLDAYAKHLNPDERDPLYIQHLDNKGLIQTLENWLQGDHPKDVKGVVLMKYQRHLRDNLKPEQAKRIIDGLKAIAEGKVAA